jgi:hypothetical protein
MFGGDTTKREKQTNAAYLYTRMRGQTLGRVERNSTEQHILMHAVPVFFWVLFEHRIALPPACMFRPGLAHHCLGHGDGKRAWTRGNRDETGSVLLPANCLKDDMFFATTYV